MGGECQGPPCPYVATVSSNNRHPKSSYVSTFLVYEEWTTILFFSSGLCYTCAWRRHIIQKSKIKNYSIYSLLEVKLESTDTAPEVPHLCLTRPNARCGVQRGYSRVSPRLHFFFFFFRWIRVDSARFAPTRLDSCQIGFDLRWTGLIRPKSGRIGRRSIRSK